MCFEINGLKTLKLTILRFFAQTSYFTILLPDPSVCLIHSNPQSFIHLKLVFIHVNIAKVLLVVKTLIKI